MVLNNVVTKGVKYLMFIEYNSIGIPSIPDALPILILLRAFSTSSNLILPLKMSFDMSYLYLSIGIFYFVNSVDKILG